ncbi:uncharacterized protein LOC135199674 isoform X2 [Macrobrachium nipponense]
MAPMGWFHAFLIVIIVILVIAIQATHGLSAADRNHAKTKLKCTADPHHSRADIENDDQFYVNPEEDFSYFQISMRIGSCYPFEIYRGNRYFGREEILGSSEAGPALEGIPVSLSCGSADGNHAYQVTIGLRNNTLRKEVDTATSCGECLGFTVKAVGAIVCTEERPPKLVGQRDQKGTRKARNSMRNSMRTLLNEQLEQEVSKGVEKMRRWSSVAYVMAVCASLLLYVLILTVRSFRGMMDSCKADR